MKVVPASSDSCEDQRVVELSGPEERNVVNRLFLAGHVESSN